MKVILYKETTCFHIATFTRTAISKVLPFPTRFIFNGQMSHWFTAAASLYARPINSPHLDLRVRLFIMASLLLIAKSLKSCFL